MNREELKEKYGKPNVPHQWRKTDVVSALVCTFFGAGMLPKMPGTWGSLVAALVAYPLAIASVRFDLLAFGVHWNFMLAAMFIFFAALPFVNKAMRDTRTEDPGWIVIDEVCGQWMALAFVAPEVIVAHPWWLLVAFAFFRFFDILKPLGIHRFERFPEGWGVMADDWLGGLYAGILLLFSEHFVSVITGTQF